MIIIKEEKQVGILYHFTGAAYLEAILYDNGLKTSFHDYISFTRNYDITRKNSYLSNATMRLTFDGNKLSNKFKIEPFLDAVNAIKRSNEEWEERIKWPRYKILPCMFALKQIDILERSNFDIESLGNIKIPIQYVDKFRPVK